MIFGEGSDPHVTHTHTHTRTHTHTQNIYIYIYIYIYIVFALQGNFSGFTKGYVIGSKRHRMFMKKLHFLFSLHLNSFIVPIYSLEMAHSYS